jgi:hypothetical protein
MDLHLLAHGAGPDALFERVEDGWSTLRQG